MLSNYDMQCLSRLEDRYLDPDYDGREDEDEFDNDMWLEADRKGEEEWANRYLD